MLSSMTKQEFIAVIKLLGMNTPKMSQFLKCPQGTIQRWRAKAGPRVPGPVEVALRLEVERRGLEWSTIEEKA